MSVKSLEMALPGDVIFYVPKEDKNQLVNLMFRVGQSFWSSLSKRGVEMTHAGIILDPILVECVLEGNLDQVNLPEGCNSLNDCLKNSKDYVFISHSYATSEGANISVRPKNNLLRKYDIVAVSPIPKELGFSQEEENSLRQSIACIAICFSTSRENCQILPCSFRHLFVDPCIAPSTLTLPELKQCMAEGVVDFSFGYPRIETCNEEGKAFAKPSFCGEHVHRVLQTAFFYSQLNLQKVNAMERDGVSANRAIYNLRALREKHIQEISEGFDESFLSKMPSWILQNSTSFSPGRLYTALTEESDFRVNGLLRGSFSVSLCAAKILVHLALSWQKYQFQ